MIKINLLPPSERFSQWDHTRNFSIITILVLFLSLSIYIFNLYKVYSLQNEIDTIKEQRILFESIESNMQLASNKQEKINAKNNILSILTGQRQSWYALLSHFGSTTPNHIWLKEISFNEKNYLQIKGVASTYPDIADYIHQLERDSYFIAPLLITADNNIDQQNSTFELQVKLKGL